MTAGIRNESERLHALIDAFGNGDRKIDQLEVDNFRELVAQGPLQEYRGFDAFQKASADLFSAYRSDPSKILEAPRVSVPATVNFRYGERDRFDLGARINVFRDLVADPKVFTPKNAANLVRWLERDLAWTKNDSIDISADQAKQIMKDLGALVTEVEQRMYAFGNEYSQEHQDAIVIANRMRSYLGDHLLLRFKGAFQRDRSEQPEFVPADAPVHFQCYDPSFKALRSLRDFPDVFLITTDGGADLSHAIRRATREDAYESHLAVVIRARDQKLYVVEAGNGFGAEATLFDPIHALETEARIQFHFINDEVFASPEAKKAFFERCKSFIDLIDKNRNPYDFSLTNFPPPAPGESLKLEPDTPLMCANLVQAMMYWAPIDAYASDGYRQKFGVVHEPTGQKVVGLTPYLAKLDRGPGMRAIHETWNLDADETIMPCCAHNPLTKTVAEARNMDRNTLHQMQIDNAVNAFVMNELLNRRGFQLHSSARSRLMTNLAYGAHVVTGRRMLPFEGDAIKRPIIGTFITQSEAIKPFRDLLEKLNEEYQREHRCNMTFFQLRAALQEAYDEELRARKRGEDIKPELTAYIHPDGMA